VPSRIGRFIHPALLFVVLAWGINFSVVQIAYEKPLSPPVVAVIRWVGTVLVMALVMRLAAQNWKMSRADWLRAILAGFIGNGVYMILFLEGMARVTAAQGAIALATAPIFTAFLAILVGQDKFRWWLAIGSAVAFTGVALATMGVGDPSAEPVNGLGVLIVVVSAVVWAFSIVIMKPLLNTHHPIKVMSTSLLGAGAALVPYGIGSAIALDWGGVSARGWGALAYLILIAGAAAFVAYYKALQDIGPSRTTMVQYLVPPVAAIASWAIQGKPIHAIQIAGLALALGGLWLGSLRSRADRAAAFANQPEPASE
jgi:drug/metabolite transporter (DMT)-like permease